MLPTRTVCDTRPPVVVEQEQTVISVASAHRQTDLGPCRFALGEAGNQTYF